jgi:predicted lipid-binding transport protein (Tim44 family)
MLACLSATISATRIILAGGPPNVKPVAFLSIASGMIGGPVFGFAAGFLGMATSDLLFGVGP